MNTAAQRFRWRVVTAFILAILGYLVVIAGLLLGGTMLAVAIQYGPPEGPTKSPIAPTASNLANWVVDMGLGFLMIWGSHWLKSRQTALDNLRTSSATDPTAD